MNYLEKKKRAIMAVLQRVYSVIGVPPITLLKSLGKSLKDYLIYGNTSQNGTPSPASPVEIESVGTKTNNLWDKGNTIISDNETRSCYFGFDASSYDWIQPNRVYYVSEELVLYEDDTRIIHGQTTPTTRLTIQILYEDGTNDITGSAVVFNDGLFHKVSVSITAKDKPITRIAIRLADYSSNSGGVFHGEARNVMLTAFNSAGLSITQKSINNATVISDENNVYHVKGNDGLSASAFSAGQVNVGFSPILTKNRQFNVSFYATRVSDGVWTNSSSLVCQLFVQDTNYFTQNFYEYSKFPIGERVLISSKVFSITESTEISKVVFRLNAMEWKIETDSFRINYIDENDLEYKPYGYEIPVLSHYQENLIPYPYVTADRVISGVKIQTTGNNCIHLKGTATGNVTFVLANPILLTAGDYIFYVRRTSQDFLIDRFKCGVFLRQVGTAVYYNAVIEDQSITLTSSDNWYVYITVASGVTVDTILNVYLERGTKFPETTNIYLNEPLRKIGDFVDYIDFKNQKVVRKIKRLDSANIDLSLWKDDSPLSGGSENSMKWVNISEAAFDDLDAVSCICNKFEGFSDTGLSYGAIGMSVYQHRLRIYYPGVTDDTLDNWKTWVTDNPFTLNYVLETPTEQSVFLPEVLTVKGTCVLDTRGMYPSNMNVKYLGK
jgi:hypothetical protein